MYIRATVAKFDGKRFLLDIDAISQNANTLGSMDLPTSSSARSFPGLGIKLSMVASSNLAYTTSGSIITISQPGGASTMTIE